MELHGVHTIYLPNGTRIEARKFNSFTLNDARKSLKFSYNVVALRPVLDGLGKVSGVTEEETLVRVDALKYYRHAGAIYVTSANESVSNL